MKRAWNAMKEKRFDKRTKKLEKQALQYIQRNEKLEQQIAESQRSKITKTMDEKSGEHTDKELNDDTRELEKIPSASDDSLAVLLKLSSAVFGVALGTAVWRSFPTPLFTVEQLISIVSWFNRVC